jgi:hypothetical protein
MTATGWRTSEISVAVTNAGTVLFEPAISAGGRPVGILRSVDRGGTWEFVDPGGDPARIGSIDMNVSVDRRTGRVFWSNDLELPVGYIHNQRIDFSDDDGKTWSSSSPLAMHYDHTQIFSGAPAKHRGSRRGVVYASVSGGFTCPAYGFCGAHISKSLDGGATWSQPVAIPYPAECPAPGKDPVGGYGLKGVVGEDGTVYLPFTPCVRPYVAISHDEGDTWQLVLVANTQTFGWGELGLGMDKEGNLFAAWTAAADRLPYLSISRDRGHHWSTPLMIAAPGVKEASEPQLVAGATGQVAVTYYGSKNPPVPFPDSACTYTVSFFLPGYGFVRGDCPGYEQEIWNTYVTESFNALDKRPVFWSASLNDHAKPTFFGSTPAAMRMGGGWGNLVNKVGSKLTDYYGMAMSPNGTPWVGFFQACPFNRPIAGNPICDKATGDPNDGYFGLVGRLVRARSAAGDDDEREEVDH